MVSAPLHFIPHPDPVEGEVCNPRKAEDGPKQKGSSVLAHSGLTHFPFLVLKVIKSGSSLFIGCFQKYPYIASE